MKRNLGKVVGFEQNPNLHPQKHSISYGYGHTTPTQHDPLCSLFQAGPSRRVDCLAVRWH